MMFKIMYSWRDSSLLLCPLVQYGASDRWQRDLWELVQSMVRLLVYTYDRDTSQVLARKDFDQSNEEKK